MIATKVIFCREYSNTCIIIFIGLITRADLKKISGGGGGSRGSKDNSVQTPHDPTHLPLNPCMDYTVIKNVKREKGGITPPDSV